MYVMISVTSYINLTNLIYVYIAILTFATFTANYQQFDFLYQ